MPLPMIAARLGAHCHEYGRRRRTGKRIGELGVAKTHGEIVRFSFGHSCEGVRACFHPIFLNLLTRLENWIG